MLKRRRSTGSLNVRVACARPAATTALRAGVVASSVGGVASAAAPVVKENSAASARWMPVALAARVLRRTLHRLPAGRSASGLTRYALSPVAVSTTTLPAPPRLTVTAARSESRFIAVENCSRMSALTGTPTAPSAGQCSSSSGAADQVRNETVRAVPSGLPAASARPAPRVTLTRRPCSNASWRISSRSGCGHASPVSAPPSSVTWPAALAGSIASLNHTVTAPLRPAFASPSPGAVASTRGGVASPVAAVVKPTLAAAASACPSWDRAPVPTCSV